GDDIIGVGGDRGRCGGRGGCGGPPLVKLREEREVWLRLWRRVWREISSRLTWTGNDSLRKSGAGGDRARMLRGGARREGAAGTEWVLSPSDCLVARVIFLNRSGCPIWARLLLAAVEGSLRAVYDVDVDEILKVEGVNLALTG
ncbi:hypothetical protein POSPLADRAFT_1105743, partial [Postia placenta MAD-698-R-SB12]